MHQNPYLSEVLANLPRLLALYDADATSTTYGMGDRYRWAWGLIDFGNGTFQGGAHGLARLWRNGLWPYPTTASKFLVRIDAMFAATRCLTRGNGSLEEAFPFEGSYCVTALVAFDLLCALDLLRPEIDDATVGRWRDTVRPLVGYLLEADETHAIISNHLATAAAALLRWHRLTGDCRAENKALEIVRRILAFQSDEGWFREYEGADPGYQTLCTYYMCDIHSARPDLNLLEPLRKSVRFIWHFAHPDGSFGGLYGSRYTRFYYPPGLEFLADEVPEARALAAFLAESITNQRVVSLSAVDEPNLVPMFNAYCWAATLLAARSHSEEPLLELPAFSEIGRVSFQDAGLLIDGGARHYTIISVHKGGVLMHFKDQRCALSDAGVLVLSPGGSLGSSQGYSSDNRVTLIGSELTIESHIRPMPKSLPSPAQFIVLRLLCLTAFRFYRIREWVKRMLVSLLITNTRTWPVTVKRVISLGEDADVCDDVSLSDGYRQVPSAAPFVAIHMASQGYWQRQDEQAP